MPRFGQSNFFLFVDCVSAFFDILLQLVVGALLLFNHSLEFLDVCNHLAVVPFLDYARSVLAKRVWLHVDEFFILVRGVAGLVRHD